MKANHPLDDKTDIKIFILTLLSDIAYPVDYTSAGDICSLDGYVRPFDFAECFAELEELGHIEARGKGVYRVYSVSRTGREVAAELQDCIPEEVRTHCSVEAAKLLSLRRRGAKVDCTVTEVDACRYLVTCSMKDKTGDLLHLELTVASDTIAQRIKENFYRKPEQVLRGLMTVLAGDIDYLLS